MTKIATKRMPSISKLHRANLDHLIQRLEEMRGNRPIDFTQLADAIAAIYHHSVEIERRLDKLQMRVEYDSDDTRG